ncbi:MAG: hypothetical protein HZA23_07315 [Nitrospirae bacterium]|nr:hypothetical protein [Nitrospirota bacterium]
MFKILPPHEAIDSVLDDPLIVGALQSGPIARVGGIGDPASNDVPPEPHSLTPKD